MNEIYNQEDFVTLMAAKGYTKKDVRQVLGDFFQTLTECLADGDEVHFHGFGVFRAHNLKDKELVDFQTKQRSVVPGHRVPKFIAGKTLRRIVKEGFTPEMWGIADGSDE